MSQLIVVRHLAAGDSRVRPASPVDYLIDKIQQITNVV